MAPALVFMKSIQLVTSSAPHATLQQAPVSRVNPLPESSLFATVGLSASKTRKSSAQTAFRPALPVAIVQLVSHVLPIGQVRSVTVHCINSRREMGSAPTAITNAQPAPTQPFA